jgi:hypothetical protein
VRIRNNLPPPRDDGGGRPCGGAQHPLSSRGGESREHQWDGPAVCVLTSSSSRRVPSSSRRAPVVSRRRRVPRPSRGQSRPNRVAPSCHPSWRRREHRRVTRRVPSWRRRVVFVSPSWRRPALPDVGVYCQTGHPSRSRRIVPHRRPASRRVAVRRRRAVVAVAASRPSSPLPSPAGIYGPKSCHSCHREGPYVLFCLMEAFEKLSPKLSPRPLGLSPACHRAPLSPARPKSMAPKVVTLVTGRALMYCFAL